MTKVDRGGRIPLHYAALEGTADDVTRLLADGQDVNAVDYVGFTSLHFAAQSGRVENVRVLIAAGAEVDALDSAGNSALKKAVMGAAGDPVGVIKVLRENGADPTIKAQNGRSVLDTVKIIGNELKRAAFSDLLYDK
ncbi:ankyrin repeat domain-containing protein [Rhodococcus sp. ARC_M6]|uniref:ankyrin repeat domain-containing protein n=1 Tax=Rhodococcus sp. ARC_M6 TaxID=2928852 RepID=UPI001FB42D5B|nr:ankyrin repeat domain-containing protein [Rhodococcus sp. ARC_M6]MCJ0904407.1 ankyrin repeat domain-containing protein [Rhodococcus sp. ARC_M6]